MTINVSTLLDVALSLVFIFFTFSLFVSGIVEFINAMYDQRSRLLKLALIKVLDDKTIDRQLRKLVKHIDTSWETVAPTFAKFWNHPLVKVKRQIDDRPWVGNKPISYLNAESFSTVVLDILASASPVPTGFDDTDKQAATRVMMARIRETITNHKDVLTSEQPAVDLTTLVNLVAPLLERSDTLADVKKALEHWYDGYMEQVSGWFKRNTQAVVWAISIVVTIAMNVDTLRITRQLFMDPNLRDSLVERAAKVAAQPQSTTAPVSLSITQAGFAAYLKNHDKALDSLLTAGKPLSGMDSLSLQSNRLRYLQTTIDDLGLPIGWPIKAAGCLELVLLIVGWLLTATALSFGAPFWFDLLVQLVNIRNVAKKPASSVLPKK